MRNPVFAYAINKGADQLCSNCEADQGLCFATWIVQSLFFLNLKFQASGLFVSDLVGNIEDRFSRVAAHLFFTWLETLPTDFLRTKMFFTKPFEPLHEKSNDFAYAKTKTQISFAVTVKLISAFVFTTWIVLFLFYLYPKFQASSFML